MKALPKFGVSVHLPIEDWIVDHILICKLFARNFHYNLIQNMFRKSKFSFLPGLRKIKSYFFDFYEAPEFLSKYLTLFIRFLCHKYIISIAYEPFILVLKNLGDSSSLNGKYNFC